MAGPAVLFYNSETFSDTDLDCFTRSVGDSAKAGDSRKIGQFGLVAITAYHFTDVVLLLTGTTAVPPFIALSILTTSAFVILRHSRIRHLNN